jgi:hypothetical protein
MDQIIPMEDEESGEELRIINASFSDPYMLVLREDSTVKIFKANGSGEIEDVEASGLNSTKWLSASLFKSSTLEEIFAFLLTPEGGLHVSQSVPGFCWLQYLHSLGLLHVGSGEAKLCCRRPELPPTNTDFRLLRSTEYGQSYHYRNYRC